MLEMAAVLGIVAFLFIALIGGFASMQKNLRLSNSTKKVLSTLYLARSLAIGNNAIYHVRIENWHAVTASQPNPNPFSEQYIRVYYFPNTDEALAVTKEDNVVWDIFWDKKTTPQPPVNYNYRVGSVQMDPQTYLGIQNTYGATAPSTAVLSFNPDGTANTPGGTGMYFYVTDVMTGGSKASTPNNDYRDIKAPMLATMTPYGGNQPDGTAYYLQLNNNRHCTFNSGFQAQQIDASGSPAAGGNSTPQPSLRMIRVLPGGSIKLLEPISNGTKDRVP